MAEKGKTKVPALQKFMKVFNELQYRKDRHEAFREFCQGFAWALMLPFYSEKVTPLLRDLVERVGKETWMKYDELSSIVVDALEEEHRDFLGECFMNLELGNKHTGQFFTPYCISYMMGKTLFGNDLKAKVAKEGYVTMSEPASGSGGMVIALHQVFLDEGLNPAQTLLVETRDVAQLPYLMTYIQLSLYGVAAKVIWGNTISLIEQEVCYTPVFFFEDWATRIETKRLATVIHDLITVKETGPQYSAARKSKSVAA